MPRRAIAFVLTLVCAYGVGLASQWKLDDDPCIEFYADEADRVDQIVRWLPPRTDCRITTPEGTTRVEQGSSEVFLAMFALTLVAAFVLVSGIALVFRLGALATAGLVAFAVIFVY